MCVREARRVACVDECLEVGACRRRMRHDMSRTGNTPEPDMRTAILRRGGSAVDVPVAIVCVGDQDGTGRG